MGSPMNTLETRVSVHEVEEVTEGAMRVTLIIGESSIEAKDANEIASFEFSEEEQSYFDNIWSSSTVPESVRGDFCEASAILWEAVKRGLKEIHDNGWD